MSVSYYSATLPWAMQPEDQRFRRILSTVWVIMAVFSIVVSLVNIPQQLREEIAVPPRLARLIVQEIPPPPPVVKPVEPVPEPQAEVQKPEQKPEQKSVPKISKPIPAPAKTVVLEEPRPQPTARERAAKTGLLAVRDQLADLRADAVVANLEQQPLRKAAAPAQPALESERSIITSQVTAGSGGINTSRLSRDTGGGGRLAGRETTRVTAPAEVQGTERAGADAVVKAGIPPSRSSEEIQMIFDRNKGTLNAIYNRALRLNPALAGKVVLKLTIDPSGTVIHCEIVSSELNEPDLERKLIARVQLFDFGAKNATATTITYPIDFFPG